MPSFDYPPDGRVQLGQIITSPRDPYERLADPLPIEDQAIARNTKTDYHEVIEKAQRGKIGLWVQFLASFFGVGGDVSGKWVTEHSHILQFRELESTCFEPENNYLMDSVASSETIRTHIKKTPGKSLYMITGVKIARGARSILQEKKARGLGAKSGVDATAFTGAPIQGGPDFKIETAHYEKVQFGGSKDFVFAYRLLRIIPKRSGVIKKKRYEAGTTTFGNDDEFVEDRDQREETIPELAAEPAEFTATELDRSDYGAMPTTLPFEAEARKVMEDELDDTDCLFIIPQTGED